MAITPDRAEVPDQSTADLRQQITDLRGALEHAVRLLHFSAGREVVTDPQQSARLVAAADGMTEVLARTALQ
ncbi:hypothetical protein ACWGDX_13340 [Streptomyces sp. NPDC055025]